MRMTIEIELSNEAMRSGMDVGALLIQTGGEIAREWSHDDVEQQPTKSLYDRNGNKVGHIVFN